MICPDCRKAGNSLSETEIIYQDLHTGNQSVLTGPEVAAKMHALCPGSTWCDCAHVIPEKNNAES